MIVTFVSGAPICTIHEVNGKPYILEEEGSFPTQCNNFNFHPTINAVRYKLHERMVGHRVARMLKDSQTKSGSPTSALIPSYLKYIPLIAINVLICLHSFRACGTDMLVWWRSRSIKPYCLLEKADEWPIPSASCHTGPEGRELEMKDIDRMLAIDVVEPVQTEGAFQFFFISRKDQTLHFCDY